MRSIVRALVCGAAAASLATSAAAQRMEIPDSGRVRVTAPGWHPRRATGTIVRATPDTVMLRTGDSLVAIPRSRVARVEVPDRKRPRTTKGMLIGLGVGATLGALGGITCHDDCPDGTTAYTTAGGGAIGAIAGAGIGALLRGDSWRDASAPPSCGTIAPAPGRRRIALAVSLPTRQPPARASITHPQPLRRDPSPRAMALHLHPHADPPGRTGHAGVPPLHP